ncbi:hypothetical protein SAY87_031409 [Trapa incisa]|uniref:Pectinesterase inhibitor domain-containing protein n=1 Tax=Trapa incisa TaxID=236973 RepID=A0AAN7KPN3_9MYRT|nr:hypothetical protein SAY87_031409 [Trapa incisa]
MKNNGSPAMHLVVTLLFSVAVLGHATVVRNMGLSEGTDPQLKEACRNTSYPAICVSSLATNMENNASLADPTAVFKASLKATLTEIESVIPRLDQMIKAEKDAYDQGCLTTCKTFYGNAVEAIKKAMTDRSYDQVSITLSTCIGYITSCGDGFGENRVDKASQINDRVTNFIDNALILAETAKWQ